MIESLEFDHNEPRIEEEVSSTKNTSTGCTSAIHQVPQVDMVPVQISGSAAGQSPGQYALVSPAIYPAPVYTGGSQVPLLLQGLEQSTQVHTLSPKMYQPPV